MEEESENQTNPITPKQIETKHDYISLLPDCLLIDIISRLPTTKEAIRTGTLSKRWQHLWHFVHNLIFLFYKFSFNPDEFITSSRLSKYVSHVNKTLTQCRNLSLNKFELNMYYEPIYESEVNEWIRYAIRCNVQDLDILLKQIDGWFESIFELHEFFFCNSCFTHLKLGGCVFTHAGNVSWSRLKSLLIGHGDLDETLIEKILSGCPLLEELDLYFCYGYKRLDITSKSVKSLRFSGYLSPDIEFDDIVEINAPFVLSLTISGGLSLKKLLLLNVSSLVEAKLHYTNHEASEEIFAEGFIPKFRNVKELTIGCTCQEIFTRLKAKGLIFPSNIKYEEDEDEFDREGNIRWINQTYQS